MNAVARSISCESYGARCLRWAQRNLFLDELFDESFGALIPFFDKRTTCPAGPQLRQHPGLPAPAPDLDRYLALVITP